MNFPHISLKKLNVQNVKEKMNDKPKGASMRQDTAKVHEIISKAVITKNANPTLVQAILSWCKDTVTTIIYKDKF